MARLATFNAENLFARYKFKRNFDPVAEDGFSINDLAFDINDETAKQITARAIKEVKADILALQEVDNLKVLDRFISRYIPELKYNYRILIDAFDPRNIDVALVSKFPIKNVTTHRHERNKKNTAGLFSRDCLEVDVEINKKIITIYVNHFKSMLYSREETYDRRKEQADRVAEIIEERWSPSNYEGNYAVVGDFNDYLEGNSAIAGLVSHPGLVNVSERRAKNDRWTHFWAGGNEYRQLDFILLSPQLAKENQKAPEIMRKGLPYRAEKFKGKRFDFVGDSEPKASDHCPIYIDIDLV